MSYEVRLPDLDENGGGEATVSYWYFAEDDHVDHGEDLVELSAVGATFKLPCPVAGTIIEIVAEDGGVIEAGTLMAIIEPD